MGNSNTLVMQLPKDVAEELTSVQGVIVGRRSLPVDVLEVAVFLTGVAGSLVTLVSQGGHATKRIASAIVRWRGRQPPTERPYRLVAQGPKGRLVFDLDEKPDVDALSAFLDQL